ncbi:unnamed protein product [Umbelopsis ramanniana]
MFTQYQFVSSDALLAREQWVFPASIGCTAPCDYWADRCYIVDESSIKNHIASDPGLDSNLDPFTTYCLFLTSQATSIDLAPAKENTTMKMLYNMSQIAYAKLLDKDASVMEELNKFNDMCCKQFEKVLAMLTDDSVPRSTIKEYTSQLLQYSIQQKRKLDKITSENYLSEDQDLGIEDAKHEQMNFVDTFRNERSAKGLKMDWKLCLEEGTKRFGWKYNNAGYLRSQFSRYMKRKVSTS